MSSPTENPYGTPSTDGPEPIRSYQGKVDAVVRGLLKLPVLSGVVGKRLITLHVVGHRFCKVYDVPVAYTRHHEDLLIGTAVRPWVKNLRGKVPVNVSMGGAPKEMLADEKSVMELYEVIAVDNKQNAKFNGIGYNADGTNEGGYKDVTICKQATEWALAKQPKDARDLIAVGGGVVRENQNGSRSVIFERGRLRRGECDGNAVIATFGAAS